MFNLFKKKPENKVGLEKAKELGLITEEEFLELKMNRAQKELDDYCLESKKKKK